MTPSQVAQAIVRQDELKAVVSTKFYRDIITTDINELGAITRFLDTYQIEYSVNFI